MKRELAALSAALTLSGRRFAAENGAASRTIERESRKRSAVAAVYMI